MAFKKNMLFISFSILVVGLAFCFAVLGAIRDFDKYHWLLLLPILFPIVSIFFAGKAFAKTASYQKMLSILLILFNLVFAAVIFLTFSFSYWQF